MPANVGAVQVRLDMTISSGKSKDPEVIEIANVKIPMIIRDGKLEADVTLSLGDIADTLEGVVQALRIQAQEN